MPDAATRSALYNPRRCTASSRPRSIPATRPCTLPQGRSRASDARAAARAPATRWRSSTAADTSSSRGSSTAASRDVRVQLLSRVEPAAEAAVPLTLVQAVLKGDKMDDVVRDAVMLGVAADSADRHRRTETTVAALTRGGAPRSLAARGARVGQAVAPRGVARDPQAAHLRKLARRAAAGAALMLVEPAAASERAAVSSAAAS